VSSALVIDMQLKNHVRIPTSPSPYVSITLMFLSCFISNLFYFPRERALGTPIVIVLQSSTGGMTMMMTHEQLQQ